MFKKRMKHAHRYQEIVRAFLRNGFGYLIKDLGLTEALSLSFKKDTATSDVSQRTLGERVRIVLQELGTTFIKLGQIASTRMDIFPENIIKELEKLQDHVPPFPSSEVNRILEEELGGSIDTIFAEFHETPTASASIGQVHFARLHTGEHVAVKIQRPHIQKVIETDLEILEDIARLMDTQLDWAKNYHIRDIVEEFSKSLRAELDYSIEGRNAEKIANQFKNDSTVHIPTIYWDYSTKKVLTMEYIEGIKINNLDLLLENGYNRKSIAEKFTQCLLHQILVEGFFHGDPHPGNVIIMPGEIIGLMDFGMVGHLSQEMKLQFVSLIISLKRGNSDGIVNVLLKMGLFPEDVDLTLLKLDVESIMNKYYDLPLSQLHLGNVIQELFSIASQYHIQVPAEFTMLGKSLMTLEGLVEFLDPDCNIMSIAEPFAAKLLKERYQPLKLIESAWDQLKEYTDILASLPKSIKDLTTTVQKGKLHFNISAPELHILLKRLDKISNRLSFSIVLLAFSIIMVGLIIGSSIGRQNTILWDFPIIEVGAVVATLMFLWLLISIFRSGKF
ncbi:ABC1 kinase family protein [Cytobacillus sp. Hz8]|uniref:ABC1 kinase family protein n=1 Tax=Cytobacillus sp. Hz8 TaxID=3347168 RepID=UPI0035D8D087